MRLLNTAINLLTSSRADIDTVLYRKAREKVSGPVTSPELEASRQKFNQAIEILEGIQELLDQKQGE